jgi:peptidoglycan-associated lipoprotein
MLTFRLTQILRLAVAASVMLSLGACASFKKKPAYAGSEDGDFISGSPLPDRNEGASFLSGNVDKTRFSPVYFGFDSYSVESSEEEKLNAVASFMRNSSEDLIIAGFTDERGTAEYNRGLGEKRAQAVRSYLLNLGADGNRIQTTSFGAEMPADPGHGESAWAKNRRTEFGVVR